MTVTSDHMAARLVDSHWIRWLWLACAALAGIVLLLALPAYAQSVRLDLETEFALAGAFGVVGAAASLLAALVSLGLAGLLFWRRSDDVMALYVSFLLLFYGIIMAGPLERLGSVYPALDEAALVVQSVVLGAPIIILMLLFPNGRFVPSWTRWLVPVSVVWTIVLVAVLPTGMSVLSTGEELYGLLLLYLVLPAIAFLAQIYRYRRVSGLAERQQIKWVVYGFALWMVVIAVSSGPYAVLSSLPADAPQPSWAPLSSAFWWLSLNIMPLSLTVSVLRYRLWDLHVVVNRTLVYGGLTALLILLYFGAVVLMQALFRALTGQESQLAVVVSTLAIAGLFVPLRNRMQAFIDRRFYRNKVDARQMLDAFAVTARDEVALERLTAELLSVVQATMQPERVTLWLNGPAEARPKGAADATERPWYN